MSVCNYYKKTTTGNVAISLLLAVFVRELCRYTDLEEMTNLPVLIARLTIAI